MLSLHPRDVFFLALFCTVLLKGSLQGQDSEEQMWVDYNYTIPVSENFFLVGDAGLRGFISNSALNQVVVRPGVRYAFHESFNVSGSLGLFSTFHRDLPNVNEFRFTLDLSADGPDLLYVLPFYRLRLENRSFFHDSILHENRWRGRLLVGLESMDIKTFKDHRSVYFQAIWEGFKMLDKLESAEYLINSTRIHGAFGHKLSNKFRYEIHYIWQRSRLNAEEGLRRTQNIIRFRLFHRFGRRK